MTDLGRVPERVNVNIQRGFPFRASIKMRDGSDWESAPEIRLNSGDVWPSTISGSVASWDIPDSSVDAARHGEHLKLVYGADILWGEGRLQEGVSVGFGGQSQVLALPHPGGGQAITSPAVKGDEGRGIASIADPDESGTAVVTYTDGAVDELPLPEGPPGAPGGSDEATAEWVRTGEETRAALAEVTPPALPAPLLGATTTTLDPTTGVWVCDAIGDTFYGSRQGKIWSSTDGLVWVEVCDTPAVNIVLGLRASVDGEVVAIMASGAYKSSGWGTGTVTWSQKVASTGLAGPQAFGFDGDGQKFIVSEYGPGAGQAWVDSRYAHISVDAGDTWTPAYDSNVVSGNAPVDSHVHGCCYDPWNDTFYVSEGHGAGGGIYHSTDDGATWHLAPGMAIGQAGSASPTSITATDDGLVIGSDSATMQGVYGVVRTSDPMDQQLTHLWAWRAPRSGNNGWGAKGLRDPRTGLVYIAWKTQGAGLRPIITGGSPFASGLVWESPDPIATADALEFLAVTDSGRLAALGNISGVAKTVTGTVGRPALTSQPDAGGVGGGVALDATSVSVGRGATGSGYARSTALGVNAEGHQDAVVTGYGAAAGGAYDVVTGAAAHGSGSDAILGAGATGTGGANAVIGSGATGAGTSVAVGRNAKAAGTSTAVGYGAEALVGSMNVAVGFQTKATGSYQIAVGPRHVEYTEVATEPGPPVTNQVRVYTVDNAGETELRARFAGSANRIVKIASSLGTSGMAFDPVYATAFRPSAVTAGAGARYFDSTAGKPVWSNGTDWVDATGATV